MKARTRILCACLLMAASLLAVVLIIGNSIRTSGLPPLHWAAYNGHVAATWTFLKLGFDPNAKHGNWVTAADVTFNLEMDPPLDESDQRYYAAEFRYRNNAAILSMLLDAGGRLGEPVAATSTQWHHLFRAMMLDREAGGSLFTETLLRNGYDPDTRYRIEGIDEGMPMLHLASDILDSPALVMAFIEHEANTEAEWQGETALELAERKGHAETVKVLQGNQLK